MAHSTPLTSLVTSTPTGPCVKRSTTLSSFDHFLIENCLLDVGRVLADAARTGFHGGAGRRRVRSGGGLAGRGRRVTGPTCGRGAGVQLLVRTGRRGSGLAQHGRHGTGRLPPGLRCRRRLHHRHPGQHHRPRHRCPGQRRERERRGGEGEPRRRRVRHQVAHLPAHRLGRVRPRQAYQGGDLRADLGERLRDPRPEGLGPPGLHRRQGVEDPGHPLRRELRGAVPDEVVRHSR